MGSDTRLTGIHQLGVRSATHCTTPLHVVSDLNSLGKVVWVFLTIVHETL